MDANQIVLLYCRFQLGSLLFNFILAQNMASNLQRGSIILLVVLLLLDVSIAARFFHSNKKDYNIPKVDPYKVLGVKRQASDADIQKAYRRKARETHRESLHI